MFESDAPIVNAHGLSVVAFGSPGITGTLMDFKITADPTLPPNVIEIRDRSGHVVCRVINVGFVGE